jgi:hypothetical protein
MKPADPVSSSKEALSDVRPHRLWLRFWSERFEVVQVRREREKEKERERMKRKLEEHRKKEREHRRKREKLRRESERRKRQRGKRKRKGRRKRHSLHLFQHRGDFNSLFSRLLLHSLEDAYSLR